MKCPYCGYRMEDGDRFCENCGASVGGESNGGSGGVQAGPGFSCVMKGIVLVLVIALIGGTAVWILTADRHDADEQTLETVIEFPEAETPEEEEELAAEAEEAAQAEEEENGGDEDENAGEDDTEAESGEEEETAPDYILPDSDTRYLTQSDIEDLTQEELRLARNEIYARHGRKFDDEELQAYFEQFEWYSGTVDPDDFSESMLNEYEIANAALISEYETEQGYR